MIEQITQSNNFQCVTVKYKNRMVLVNYFRGHLIFVMDVRLKMVYANMAFDAPAGLYSNRIFKNYRFEFLPVSDIIKTYPVVSEIFVA